VCVRPLRHEGHGRAWWQGVHFWELHLNDCRFLGEAFALWLSRVHPLAACPTFSHLAVTRRHSHDMMIADHRLSVGCPLGCHRNKENSPAATMSWQRLPYSACLRRYPLLLSTALEHEVPSVGPCLVQREQCQPSMHNQIVVILSNRLCAADQSRCLLGQQRSAALKVLTKTRALALAAGPHHRLQHRLGITLGPRSREVAE